MLQPPSQAPYAHVAQYHPFPEMVYKKYICYFENYLINTVNSMHNASAQLATQLSVFSNHRLTHSNSCGKTLTSWFIPCTNTHPTSHECHPARVTSLN